MKLLLLAGLVFGDAEITGIHHTAYQRPEFGEALTLEGHSVSYCKDTSWVFARSNNLGTKIGGLYDNPAYGIQVHAVKDAEDTEDKNCGTVIQIRRGEGPRFFVRIMAVASPTALSAEAAPERTTVALSPDDLRWVCLDQSGSNCPLGAFFTAVDLEDATLPEGQGAQFVNSIITPTCPPKSAGAAPRDSVPTPTNFVQVVQMDGTWGGLVPETGSGPYVDLCYSIWQLQGADATLVAEVVSQDDRRTNGAGRTEIFVDTETCRQLCGGCALQPNNEPQRLPMDCKVEATHLDGTPDPEGTLDPEGTPDPENTTADSATTVGLSALSLLLAALF